MSPTQSPYTPPAAPVADPAEPEVPKPPAIWWAVKCLWISIAVMVIATVLAVAGVSGSREAIVATIVTSGISGGLLVLVAVALNARRNWSRWVFLVLFILGSAVFALGLALAPQAYAAMPRLDQISALVQFALQTAALVFMFLPASGDWLRTRRAG